MKRRLEEKIPGENIIIKRKRRGGCQRRGSESSISLAPSCCVSTRLIPAKSNPSHCHGQHMYLGLFRPVDVSLLSSSSSWRVSSSTLSLNLEALKSASLNDFSAASLAAMAASAVSSLNFSFFPDSTTASFAASSSWRTADNYKNHQKVFLVIVSEGIAGMQNTQQFVYKELS